MRGFAFVHLRVLLLLRVKGFLTTKGPKVHEGKATAPSAGIRVAPYNLKDPYGRRRTRLSLPPRCRVASAERSVRTCASWSSWADVETGIAPRGFRPGYGDQKPGDGPAVIAELEEKRRLRG